MARRDPRIDAYIGGAAPFARPILRHVRGVVHAACPGVEETIKWGMPAFEYHGLLCMMAAFQRHATFGFWRGGSIVVGRGRNVDEAMGHFGRLTSLDDLPAARVLAGYVKKAMARNEAGMPSRPARKPRPMPRVPAALAAALAKNRAARAAFAAFSPSHRREYIEWVAEAKRDETRARRVATAIAWLVKGRHRNWRSERRARAQRRRRLPPRGRPAT